MEGWGGGGNRPFDFYGCVGGGGGGGRRGVGVWAWIFFSSATRACLYIHVFTKRTKTFTLVLAIFAGKRGS